MNDLHKAMRDLATIRYQLVSGTEFRGFGPLTIALTAVLAVITGALQSIFPALASSPFAYFSTWIITAIIAVLLVGAEMIARTKRHHQGMADEMLLAAAGNFLPAGVVGALLLMAFGAIGGQLFWLLPPLWLILVGLGVLSSMRILPSSVSISGGAYILLGFFTLLLNAHSTALSPWAMAIPFALGQALLAFLLHTASRKTDDTF